MDTLASNIFRTAKRRNDAIAGSPSDSASVVALHNAEAAFAAVVARAPKSNQLRLAESDLKVLRVARRDAFTRLRAAIAKYSEAAADGSATRRLIATLTGEIAELDRKIIAAEVAIDPLRIEHAANLRAALRPTLEDAAGAALTAAKALREAHEKIAACLAAITIAGGETPIIHLPRDLDLLEAAARRLAGAGQ